MPGHVPRRRRPPLLLEICVAAGVDAELAERLLATDDAGAALETVGNEARRRGPQPGKESTTLEILLVCWISIHEKAKQIAK